MSTTNLAKLLNLSGLMVALVGLLVSILIPFWNWSGVHDFSASINPMTVDVKQGNITHIKVNVIFGWLYREDISLRLESVPQGIHFKFKPEIIKHGNKSISDLTILVDKDVIPGIYLMSVVCDGADGKKEGCEFSLNVSGSIPILTPTTTSTLNSNTNDYTTPTTTSTLNSNNNSYTNTNDYTTPTPTSTLTPNTNTPSQIYSPAPISAPAKLTSAEHNDVLSNKILEYVLVFVSGPMLVLVGILISIWSAPKVNDFSAFVNQMVVDVKQGNSTNIRVDVIPGWFYKKDVRLRSKHLPSGIQVKFEPEIIKNGKKSTSNVTISAKENVILGEHLMSVVCDGADGKKHVCKFALNINGSIPTPASIGIATADDDGSLFK